MTKKIMIDFANPEKHIRNYPKEFKDAVKFVNCNLYLRHRIKITEVRPYAHGWYLITVEMPDDVKFSNRYLRGLSAYFMRSENVETYKKYRVGTRLFSYIEL